MGYQHLLFFGLSRSHFVNLKTRYGLHETTQIHHIIPRQFRKHRSVRNLDINNGCNLMLLPNRAGVVTLSTTRPLHEGGHNAYNEYVGSQLDLIATLDPEEHDTYVSDLIHSLRWRVRCRQVPWR